MPEIRNKNRNSERRSRRLSSGPDAASDRLVEVGTRLFATRGFDGTSIRDLAEAAGVNVAAVHYHFGGKDQLYAAVIQHVFGGLVDLRARLEDELRAAQSAGTRAAAEAALGNCIREFMRRLISDGKASWAGAYLQRESLQPSSAMQQVIDTFIKPTWNTFLALLALLRPDLANTETLHFISSSIVGQCLYYQQDLPVALATHGLAELGTSFVERAVSHITAFSSTAIAHYRIEESAR